MNDKLANLIKTMKLKPCTCHKYNPMIRDYKLSAATDDEYDVMQCLNCRGQFVLESIEPKTEKRHILSWDNR